MIVKAKPKHDKRRCKLCNQPIFPGIPAFSVNMGLDWYHDHCKSIKSARRLRW